MLTNAKKEELKKYYQDTIYGQWRSGENVSYEVLHDGQVKIIVSIAEKQTDFTVKLYLPDRKAVQKFDGKCPFIISMHPIAPMEYALSQGYGVIVMDTHQIASDDNKHKGCFYELYPYGRNAEEQTGVLMAWAWGAAKVIDAVAAGLDKDAGKIHKNMQQEKGKLLLDIGGIIVTGVSRWGKATAVCGAFDERVTMTVPACSGAGGLALYEFVSEGRTYNFESIGGPAAYTYGANEPLSCLQSEAERGWFNDRFLEYQSPDAIPIDQYMLPILAADKRRFYFIIAACMGEDWVNAPSMWECYKRADEQYREKGLANHLVVHFHKEGHAVIEEDMRLMTAYFNKVHYGIKEEINIAALKTSVFDKQKKEGV